MDDADYRGRNGIDSMKRTHHSKRAMAGVINVIKKYCPKCGHKKAIDYPNKTKCSRCGYLH